MSILKEDNGSYSMIRIMSLIVTLSGVAVGVIPVVMGTLTVEGVSLSLGMITIGVTGKTVSKKLEA
jgi:VIT1/CCC1 family predicted Fe2+/Mn2+ transporter